MALLFVLVLIVVIPPVESEQKRLDEPAGGLTVGAEEDRNVEVDDDGKNGSENGVGMRPGTVTSAENVAEVGLIPGETLKLPPKPFPGTDDGGDEVLEGLALHRHRVLASLDRVVPGGKCMAGDRHALGIKEVVLLFPRVVFSSARGSKEIVKEPLE